MWQDWNQDTGILPLRLTIPSFLSEEHRDSLFLSCLSAHSSTVKMYSSLFKTKSNLGPLPVQFCTECPTPMAAPSGLERPVHSRGSVSCPGAVPRAHAGGLLCLGATLTLGPSSATFLTRRLDSWGWVPQHVGSCLPQVQTAEVALTGAMDAVCAGFWPGAVVYP